MLPEDFHIEEHQLGPTRLFLCFFKDFDPGAYTRYLTPTEVERMLAFQHIMRQQEFTATRILRHQIFGFAHIHYDVNGAPYIEDEGFISISHCKNAVGIALNHDFRIGLDLEAPRQNILTLKDKFLSEHEREVFAIDDPNVVTRIWSAKEALYKLAGRKKIHFKTELLLTRDNDDNWSGQIVNPEADIFVKLNIFERNSLIVSINSEPIVEKIRHT